MTFTSNLNEKIGRLAFLKYLIIILLLILIFPISLSNQDFIIYILGKGLGSLFVLGFSGICALTAVVIFYRAVIARLGSIAIQSVWFSALIGVMIFSPAIVVSIILLLAIPPKNKI
jgi:hypothetical protein